MHEDVGFFFFSSGFVSGERTQWRTRRVKLLFFFFGVAEIEFLKRVSRKAGGGRSASAPSCMGLRCRSNMWKSAGV